MGRNRQARGVAGEFIRAAIACEIRSYASNIVVWPPGEPKPIRGRDIRRDSGWVFPAGIRTYATDEISCHAPSLTIPSLRDVPDGLSETIRKAPEGRQHVARGVSPWTRIPTTTVPPSAAPTPGDARGWGGGRGKSGGGWRPVLQGLTPLATC